MSQQRKKRGWSLLSPLMKGWFMAALLAESVALFCYLTGRHAESIGLGVLRAFAGVSFVVLALYMASRSGSAEREEDAAGPGEAQ